MASLGKSSATIQTNRIALDVSVCCAAAPRNRAPPLSQPESDHQSGSETPPLFEDSEGCCKRAPNTMSPLAKNRPHSPNWRQKPHALGDTPAQSEGEHSAQDDIPSSRSSSGTAPTVIDGSSSGSASRKRPAAGRHAGKSHVSR